MRLTTILWAIFDRFMSLLAFIAGALVILMMLGVSAEVAARYFFNIPLLGVVEISEFIILWLVFLGVAWVLRKEGHVSMDLVINQLGQGTRAVINIITSLMGALISLVILYSGTIVTLNLFQKGTKDTGGLAVPMALIIIIIPVGCLPLLIQFLRRTYGYWRGARTMKKKAARTEEYV